MLLTTDRRIEHDWYNGIIPPNVAIDPDAYLETSYSFLLYRSRRPDGLRMAAGSAAYTGTMFDTGPNGRVSLGRCSLIKVGWIICDEQVQIGDYVLISWNVLIMDSYRAPIDPAPRRAHLRRVWSNRDEYDGSAPARPIKICDNVWIGFDCVILPGVTIGEGSIIGARSVVAEDVPPYTIVAGNPARIVRRIEPQEARPHG